ncbi:DUF962 domain-containing protein [Sphingopyxis witflariensis]|uniref:DUF962 domain-containing protein n=1 Tax=Sphingopyxis witflariensis TaxID=173675 RepID=A0A246J8L3_9SPHN|nr:Mpo1-like protein [Sphingopyxis witflariensis]OWQ88985.1 hypothetical protein CDQ91_20585 [Sphingopyxis witflariensis]
MKSLADHLSQYAAYHRDSRNIITHVIGIPMIVVAVAILLSRPSLILFGWPLSPAVLVAAAGALFYLRLDLRFGAVMTGLLALSVLAGQALAAESTAVWLGWGLGLFVIGWIIQFVGHYYEGRKPAFVDDVMGLAVGPLFIVAEIAFWLGLRDDVRRVVEERSGPVRVTAR